MSSWSTAVIAFWLIPCCAFRIKSHAFRIKTDAVIASTSGIRNGTASLSPEQWHDCKRKPSEHSGKWMTLAEAGWSKDDIKRAQEESVEEGNNPAFQHELLKHVVSNGLHCCAPFNDKILELTHPENPEEYLDESLQSSSKNVVFVLGPSGVGKTSSVATVMEEYLKFPAFTYDGADWRKASQVWKCNAQNPHGPRLKDYFDTVNSGAKKKFKELFREWVTEHQPNTIIVPETAVPCVSIRGRLLHKTCKFLDKMKFMESLGYTNFRFVAVHAKFETVHASGHARAMKEGKAYSPCTYALAMASVFNLYNAFPPSGSSDAFSGKYSWVFIENTFSKDDVPRVLTWEEYKEVASIAFAEFQEATDSLELGCKKRYMWLANHTLSRPKV